MARVGLITNGKDRQFGPRVIFFRFAPPPPAKSCRPAGDFSLRIPRIETVVARQDFASKKVAHGQTFLRSTALDNIPAKFPKIVIDLAVAASISDVHNCSVREVGGGLNRTFFQTNRM